MLTFHNPEDQRRGGDTALPAVLLVMSSSVSSLRFRAETLLFRPRLPSSHYTALSRDPCSGDQVIDPGLLASRGLDSIGADGGQSVHQREAVDPSSP